MLASENKLQFTQIVNNDNDDPLEYRDPNKDSWIPNG